MSDERIGVEKALPMLILGAGCIFATIVVFGILCGNMIRTRRRIEKMQREKQEKYPVYTLTSQSQNSNFLLHNTNQSAAIFPFTTKLPIALDPTFKIHPYHLSTLKHIIEL